MSNKLKHYKIENYSANKNKKLVDKKTKEGCLGCLGIIVVIFVIALIAGLFESGDEFESGDKVNVSLAKTDFRFAIRGDYWVIEDDNIALMKERKLSGNKAQFQRNLQELIGNGTEIEILETQGTWKRVYVYDDRNNIYAEGWIMAETVKKARRTQD